MRWSQVANDPVLLAVRLIGLEERRAGTRIASWSSNSRYGESLRAHPFHPRQSGVKSV